MGDKSRGLYVGRFQPFHNGHMCAVETILKEVDEVIIGVAFTEQNFSYDNPFTCGERIEMIWRSLDGDIRKRCLIIPIPNQENNRLWTNFILQYLPSFGISFTNNTLQKLLLQEEGIHVKSISFTNREDLSGSMIRDLIAQGAPWEHLVPSGTASVLQGIGAEERLKALANMNQPSSQIGANK